MKFLTKTVIAAALSSIAFAASAMTPIADTELSQVSGQDGVSIAANLNVNIGSFTYTNNAAATGGSVSFNNIAITGVMAATLDVQSSLVMNGVFAAIGTTTNTFYDGASDVVAIAIPAKATLAGSTGSVLEAGMTVKVGGISMGHSTASFGSMAMNNIDLRGTSVYIWAH